MLKLFNVLANAVVPKWPGRVFSRKVMWLGIGANSELVRTFLALFYADDGYLASWDPELLLELVDTLVELFERVGLLYNTTKTQAMVCVPGMIRVRLSLAPYHRRYSGFQSTAGWTKRCVECHVCGLDFLASSL